jgi:hypothetical protein
MSSIEQKILASAADISPDVDQLEKLRRLVSHDLDANLIIELAIKEGVGGLLYRNLKKADALDRVDPEVGQRLQAIYYQTFQLNLKLIHDLKQVLHKLNQENVHVVLMQGVALLQQVYPDVGLRPMKDIDLWVLSGEYDKLVSSLVGLGFQREEFYPSTYKKSDTFIDISTHILWADRIKARGLLLDKDQESIFHDTRATDIEGEKARCLNPYDQVLYLGLHTIKHFAERLIWLVDIKGLIKDWKRAEWKALKLRASELGLVKVMPYILFLLKDLLDYRLPSDGCKIFKETHLNILEKAILKKRKHRDSLPGWSQLLLLPAGKGTIKKLAFFFETLFPRPEILRQVFAGSPHLKTWQLYWKRGLQLLGFYRTF